MSELIYRKALMKTSRFRGKFGLSVSVTLLISFFIVETGFLPSAYCNVPDPSLSVSTPITQLAAQSPLNEFTYVDTETNSYAVFGNPASSDVPVAMGSLESDRDAARLAPSLRIEAFDDLYVLRDPRDPDFLEVIERLPEGGFGRILRYRGKANGRSVDLEFIYQDREKRITVLDHQAGRFYRTTLTEEEAKLFTLLFPFPEEKDFNFKLTANQVSSQKFLHSLSKIQAVLETHGSRLYSISDISSEEDSWMSRLLRGPPEGSISR